MRLPDPGKKHRRQLSDLLTAIPDLTVVVDSFEQRVQRPPRDNSHFSGKKKQNTLKSQVTVEGHSGYIVDTSPSVPGPTSDLTLLKELQLLDRLPDDVGWAGDQGYLGLDKLCHQAFPPRRNRAARPVYRKTASIIVPLPRSAWSWNGRLVVCVAFNRSLNPTVTTVATTPRVSPPWQVW